jgi:hypothetical protein
MSELGLDLRAIVAEVVREMVPQTSRQPTPVVQPPAAEAPGAALVTRPVARDKVERVRIVDDGDLDQFVRRLIALFENPKNRQDLRAGRLRFSLDGASTRSGNGPTALPATRIESGAVTERHVKEAADQGRRLLLGRRAVLTPLGRERARLLGVPIEKER